MYVVKGGTLIFNKSVTTLDVILKGFLSLH